MWRPDKEKWEHNKFYDCMTLTAGGGEPCNPYEVYEAGADAMLKSLERLIRKIDPSSKLIDILYKEGR